MARPAAFDALNRPLAPELEAGGTSISIRNLIVPISLSVLVLGIVIVWTWEPDTLRQITEINLWLMAAALLAVGLKVLFSGLRLYYIAHGNVSVMGGIRGGIAWDFMSAVTPSSMGGAPLAAYFVARDNRLPIGDATALMIFSMVADQLWFAVSIPLVLLGGLYFDIFPEALGAFGAGTIVLFLTVVMLWAFFFAYATIVRPTVLEWVATRIVRLRFLSRFEGRVRRELVSMRSRGRVIRGQPTRFYVITFLYTIGLWLTRYATVVLVIVALYPAFDVITGFLRTAAMLLTGLIVPTPGGAGGVEGLFVLFLAPLMPTALVGPSVLIWRLISYHFFIAAGVAVIVQHVSRRRRGKAGLPIPVRRIGPRQQGGRDAAT